MKPWLHLQPHCQETQEKPAQNVVQHKAMLLNCDFDGHNLMNPTAHENHSVEKKNVRQAN